MQHKYRQERIGVEAGKNIVSRPFENFSREKIKKI